MSTGYVFARPSGARGRRFCSLWVSGATSRCGTRSSGRSTAPASRRSPSTLRVSASRRTGFSRGAWAGSRARSTASSGRSAAKGSTYSASRSAARSRNSWRASPRTRPQARARRHGTRGPGLGGVPGRPSAMLALATPLRYYSSAYFRKVAPTLYGGRIRREPELMAEQAHARLTRPPRRKGTSRSSMRWGRDQLPLVAVDRPSHARHGGRRRSDHPARQRAHPGAAVTARAARGDPGWRPPLPPGGGGAISGAGE